MRFTSLIFPIAAVIALFAGSIRYLVVVRASCRKVHLGKRPATPRQPARPPLTPKSGVKLGARSQTRQRLRYIR